ncbi:MAG: hypothetical protein JJU05_09150 [Verrucomicrobia bacterium]|nr:hypothetical protein [Verrucomicrobiota bacterium]MCH8527623.1 hypothetical protein [Kiritimatiellia bacterium]
MSPYFSPRPDHTLLVLDGPHALRIDLRRGPTAYEVCWLHQADEEAQKENPLRLLGHRKRPARQVTLLTSECRSLIVELPSYGLGNDNLEDILALEAEQLTGESRDLCECCHITLKNEAEMKTFRVLQMDLQRILHYRNEVAAFRGCTLTGLGHPGLRPEVEADGIPWEDASALTAWASRWAEPFRVLDGRMQGIPCFQVPPKPVGMRQQVRIGALALLGGAALIGLDSFVKGQKLETLRAELAAIEAPANRGRELNEEINHLRRDLNRAPASAPGGVLHRNRLALLLTELREGVQAEAALAGIEQSDTLPVVTLLAPTAEAAHRVEHRLGPRLESIGWRMRVAEREATHLWPDGGPHRLRLRLEPLEGSFPGGRS